MKVADVVCLITQAPIPGNDSLYAQMMVAYQQMVSALPVPNISIFLCIFPVCHVFFYKLAL